MALQSFHPLPNPFICAQRNSCLWFHAACILYRLIKSVLCVCVVCSLYMQVGGCWEAVVSSPGGGTRPRPAQLCPERTADGRSHGNTDYHHISALLTSSWPLCSFVHRHILYQLKRKKQKTERSVLACFSPQWDAFSIPELKNFLRILEKEEQEQKDAVIRRYETYRQRLQEALLEVRGPS